MGSAPKDPDLFDQALPPLSVFDGICVFCAKQLLNRRKINEGERKVSGVKQSCNLTWETRAPESCQSNWGVAHGFSSSEDQKKD